MRETVWWCSRYWPWPPSLLPGRPTLSRAWQIMTMRTSRSGGFPLNGDTSGPPGQNPPTPSVPGSISAIWDPDFAWFQASRTGRPI